MDHLRFAGKTDREQRVALENILRDNAVIMSVLQGIRTLDLPDCWLVSGAIYNLVWNVLTGQTPLNGIKDVDIIYFDARDLSYEAEDVHIKRAQKMFATLPLPVEVRNQARVHLWFPQKFNQAYEPLTKAVDSLRRYASKTHAIAVRLDANDQMIIAAPFGLDLLFSFQLVPNHALQNKVAHDEKGKRALQNWPQLTLEPW